MCQRVSCVPLSVGPVTTKFDVKKKITSEIKFLLVLGKVVVKKSRQTQFITPVPLDKRIATPEWCYMCSKVHTLLSTSHMHFIRQRVIQTWDANQSEPHFVSLQLRKWREAAFLLLTATEILLKRVLVPGSALEVGCMWFHPISCDGHHSVLQVMMWSNGGKGCSLCYQYKSSCEHLTKNTHVLQLCQFKETSYFPTVL